MPGDPAKAWDCQTYRQERNIPSEFSIGNMQLAHESNHFNRKNRKHAACPNGRKLPSPEPYTVAMLSGSIVAILSDPHVLTVSSLR
jgi:hypothetical protein